MSKEEQKKFNNWFKITAMVILVIYAVLLPILFSFKKVSADTYLELVATYGSDSEEVASYHSFDLPVTLYRINCCLCVISIILQVIYFGVRKIYKFETKGTFLERFRKSWPCFLLAFFMAWTSIGCIQAGMEAQAERIVNQASNIEKVPERLVKIAQWTSGDRMPNAADRSWNGCDNLKDGYFSFMFYATILLNVLMLGSDSEKSKRIIMRILLFSSMILGVLALLAFYRPVMFTNSYHFNRAIFNNLNHYGYYITVVLSMSVCMWIKEKNYYFKGMYLLNSILHFLVLILNNTFGAYIGIFFFMVFLFIVTLIRSISHKKASEFVEYLVCLGVFILFSSTISGAYSNSYFVNNNLFSYSQLNANLGNSTYRITFNSFSKEDAEKLNIVNTRISGVPVVWGTQIEKLENKIDTNVQRNVNGLKNDIKVLSKYVSRLDKKKNDVGNVVSGETTTKIKVTQEEYNALLQAVSEKFQKVSGETLEEFNARQEAIEKGYHEIMEKYEVSEDSSETNKSGLSDEVSGIGSGRGEAWIRSLDLVNQRPWFGWGLENMLNEFYKQYGIQEGRTHNLVLQLAGTTGVVGVISYLIATISIFFKNLFDAQFRKYSSKKLGYIGIGLLVAMLATFIIARSITDKLLFIWGAITIVEIILIFIVFTKKVKLRITEWNDFEFVGCGVFVAYMIGSLFGNSAFYTSPYFMIFLGMLVYEMLNKKSLFEEIAVEPAKIIETANEKAFEEHSINNSKEVKVSSSNKVSSNNKKKNKKK